eukprot:4091289-Prymnesium_polylepis.1
MPARAHTASRSMRTAHSSCLWCTSSLAHASPADPSSWTRGARPVAPASLGHSIRIPTSPRRRSSCRTSVDGRLGCPRSATPLGHHEMPTAPSTCQRH